MKRTAIILFAVMLASCSPDKPEATPTETVRVAAVQCASVMGSTEDNVLNICALARRAAEEGARIVVFPECAVQGYVDPVNWVAWTTNTGTAYPYVGDVAEPVPGLSTDPSEKSFGR